MDIVKEIKRVGSLSEATSKTITITVCGGKTSSKARNSQRIRSPSSSFCS
ncbi:hypothetical protein DsansV1_C03g0029381 [Dioscorea sansibarensis]